MASQNEWLSVSGSALNHKFHVAKGQNPNYMAFIKNHELGVEVVADIPEQTAYSLSADFEALLPMNAVNFPMGNFAGAFAGTSVIVQESTKQAWVNSSPIDIPITLLFDAVNDALEEVYKPMRILEAMVCPLEWQLGTLISPGPSKINPNGGMDVRIGNMFNMEQMLLVGCNCTYDTRLSTGGWPISGQAELTFRTNGVMSKQAWLQSVHLAGALG